MIRTPYLLLPLAMIVLTGMPGASAQTAAAPAPVTAAAPAQTGDATVAAAAPGVPAAIEPLLDFRPSDIKFELSDLMDTLSDRRHEGWVLAAYPDPKTGRPLIGAGFSLDLPERQHPQPDPLNPHIFVEPSSAELWQAAGLDPERLQEILAGYHEKLASWKKKRYRRRIAALEPQITDEQATALLRIAAIQAVVNAKAYCRNFDLLSGSQQMALSQLVYQMGVNLGEFGHFLELINTGSGGAELQAQGSSEGDPAYWDSVQQSLMQSQWARLYRTRAVSVIAMLDPQYRDDPRASEQRIAAVLRPAVSHRRRHHGRASLRVAAYSRHFGRMGRRRASAARRRRRV